MAAVVDGFFVDKCCDFAIDFVETLTELCPPAEIQKVYVKINAKVRLTMVVIDTREIRQVRNIHNSISILVNIKSFARLYLLGVNSMNFSVESFCLIVTVSPTFFFTVTVLSSLN